MYKIEPLLLSADEAAATSTYLKELSIRYPSVPVLVQALFGRCCLSTLPAAGLHLEELLEETVELSHLILNHPEPHGLELDPMLLVETHEMLRDAGSDLAGMRALLQRIASELLAQPAETLRVGRVRGIATRLASLGFPIRPAKPSGEMAALLRSSHKWFTAPVAQLAEIADHLVADGRPLDETSTRVLSLIALAELRNYRVDLGCSLLRTVFQLGEPCSESTEALYFIALQRRRDGRYGFPTLLAESPSADGDQEQCLYLPLTVNAVWLFRIRVARRWRPESALSA